MVDGIYQGGRDEYPFEYTDFRTPTYLTGYAKKMVWELEKVARLYNGKKVHVFRPDDSEERCPECTDMITGEQVFSGCDTCDGSGKKMGYKKISVHWAYLDVAQEHRVATGIGTTDNPGGIRHQLVFVGEPLLRDEDLIITEDTKKVYKIIEIAPQLVAMAGSVVTQLGQISRITPGQIEYNLIDFVAEKLIPGDGEVDEQGWESLYKNTDGKTSHGHIFTFTVPKGVKELALSLTLSKDSKIELYDIDSEIIYERNLEKNDDIGFDPWEYSDKEKQIFGKLEEDVRLTDYHIEAKYDTE